MRPSASAAICGNTKFSDIPRSTALVEEAGSNNSVRRIAAPHADLGAVAKMLHWSMWVLTAPNLATVAVYKTTFI
jgi:hypothetical protein